MQSIKRMYTIENVDADFIRGWQGHKIEQRWFSPISGSFKIKLIEPNNWENPSQNLPVLEFVLNAESLDVLHVPPGFISSIQATATIQNFWYFPITHWAKFQMNASSRKIILIR